METAVVLQSSSHAVRTLQELYGLQREEKFCDVRLNTDTGSVLAHRLVLMVSSPYLKSNLSNDDKHAVGLMYFDKIPVHIVERVVKFMYTGKLEVESSTVDELLKFCEYLELSSAIDLLKEFIKNTEVSTNSGNDSSVILENASSQKETEVEVKTVKAKKAEILPRTSNRRVKRTPKKRAATEAAVQQELIHVPCKSIKLSSGSPTQKAIEKSETEKKSSNQSRKNSNKKCIRLNSDSPTQKSIEKSKTEKKISNQSRKNSNKKSRKSKTGKTSDNLDNTNGRKVRKAKLNSSDKAKHKPGSSESEEKLQENVTKDKNTNQTVITNELKPVTKIDKHDSAKAKSESVENNGIENAEINVSEPVKKTGEIVKGRKLSKPVTELVKKPKVYPCTYCNKVLTTNKRLVFHEFSQHGVEYDKTKYKMVPCPYEGCSYIAANQNNLKTHTKSRHGTERPHVCEFCGKTFKLRNILTTHLNVHTWAKVFECKHCGKRFSQQAGLDVHVKRHHTGESSWGELCHLCSEKFIQKSELCWHLFRVHDQPLPDRYKAYVCDICDYLTKTSQDLERHKNAHKGIKQFLCTICKKSCATKSELKRHIMYHGEKSFKCSFDNCSYASVDASGLKKHILLMHTHKNYKPYICSVCKYKTSVKGNLDKHIRQVHHLEVVTKHTVNRKVRYKNFQTGDIITKDGQLVVSAQDRKLHQQQELAQVQNSTEETVIVDKEVDTSVDSIIICEPLIDTDISKAQTEPEFIVPQTRKFFMPQAGIQPSQETQPKHNMQEPGKYQDTHVGILSSPETVEIASCEPINSQSRVLANYIYSQGAALSSQFTLPIGVQDLRTGVSSNLSSSNLYQEGIQAYMPNNSLANAEIMN